MSSIKRSTLAFFVSVLLGAPGCGGDGSTNSSSAGGKGGGGPGAGGMAACSSPAQCPPPANECVTATCVDGQCGISFVASGAATSSQADGDCKKSECDGSGHIAIVDDDDVPDDGNPCTVDACDAGVASHSPKPAGTMCGQDLVCDANGNCVGCNQPSDCPGEDTACQARTCTAGACGIAFATAGTPVGTQTPGDCKEIQCDGNGNLLADAADDTDLPVDGKQCTSDVCSGGTASNPPVAAGTACNENGGSKCDGAGACVQCLEASDCGAITACRSFACNSGVCSAIDTPAGTVIANSTIGDCHSDQCDGSGGLIGGGVDDTDLPIDGKQCTSDVCTNGTASNPPVAAGTACNENGGSKCDGAGACVPPPSVAYTTPFDGSLAQAGGNVSVTFSMPMSPATLTGQTTAGACSGSIQVSLDDFTTCTAFSAESPAMSGGGTVATFTPKPGLLVNRVHKIRVTSAAESVAHAPLASQFTTPTGFATTSPNTCNGSVVISQVYGGGGDSGSTYGNDFIELHNRGATPVDLSTWSVQYASATGATWTVTNLSGTVQPGGYYLIQQAAGGGGTTKLPTPDVTGTAAMATASGKVALVSVQTALAGDCPTGPTLVDFVGYGAANCSEGSSTGATAAPSPTSADASILRAARNGCADLDHNAMDFWLNPLSPTAPPRSSASPAVSCACVVHNEANDTAEVDYCNARYPLSMTAQTGTTSALVFGRVYEIGVTPAWGPGMYMRAQLGYGPADANPQYEAGWSWVNAQFQAQYGNDDDFSASFTVPAPGTYRYVYRMSLDEGVSWTYCDGNKGDGGAGSDPNLTFELENQPILTVVP